MKEGAEPPKGACFGDFALDQRLLDALVALGFDTPTAVQQRAIPQLLEGRDMIGRARTGSGKTAAFGLPLLERVKAGGAARALVLTPTRELARQVGDALRSFAKRMKGVRIVTVYGGAPYGPQLKALRSGASVVVGTPGRVIDHLDRGSLDLSGLDYFVLDEADEMLRMGFIDDVEKLLEATPDSRQVALFSATMPVAIRRVAHKHLKNPVELQVETRALSVGHIQQHWIQVPERFKLDCLVRVLAAVAKGTTLVFARTRVGCAEMADALTRRGVAAEALHGDMSQPARDRVVEGLRSRRLQVVIATDVAARGIDVEHITHVINLDLPPDAESYVHRIGRTARAGREGSAISFVTPRAVGRLNRLRHALKVPIDNMAVPSDADIARIERRRIRTTMQRVAEGAVLTGAKALLREAAEEGGFKLDDLAAAAVYLLAQKERVSLRDMPPEGLPAWARQRPRPERGGAARGSRDRGKGVRPRRDGPDETREAQLMIPIGFSRGVRPGDIVGVLANQANLSGGSLGRISILPHRSFVGVSDAVAKHVLKVLPQVKLRGVMVPLSLARPRSDEDSPPRPYSARRGTPQRGKRSHGSRAERAPSPPRKRQTDGGDPYARQGKSAAGDKSAPDAFVRTTGPRSPQPGDGQKAPREHSKTPQRGQAKSKQDPPSGLSAAADKPRRVRRPKSAKPATETKSSAGPKKDKDKRAPVVAFGDEPPKRVRKPKKPKKPKSAKKPKKHKSAGKGKKNKATRAARKKAKADRGSL